MGQALVMNKRLAKLKVEHSNENSNSEEESDFTFQADKEKNQNIPTRKRRGHLMDMAGHIEKRVLKPE